MEEQSSGFQLVASQTKWGLCPNWLAPPKSASGIIANVLISRFPLALHHWFQVFIVKWNPYIFDSGRRGGLMVSVLDFGLNGPGSSPGRGNALCSWARHFTPMVPLSTQVYKWVPANLLLGATLRWTSIPSRGE